MTSENVHLKDLKVLEQYINKYYPKLFNIYTFNAGFKKNNSDLLVIEF